MRQLYLPQWAGSFVAGTAMTSGLPPLRSLSATFQDRMAITDSIELEYGVQMDSISLIDHLHYFSPYARLTYALGEAGKLDITYTAGNARPELGDRSVSDRPASGAPAGCGGSRFCRSDDPSLGPLSRATRARITRSAIRAKWALGKCASRHTGKVYKMRL